jgi:Abortive infection alpha
MSHDTDPLLHGEIVADADVVGDAHVVDERAVSLESQLVASAPALARVAGGVWWRAAKWGVAASARTGARVVRAATDPLLPDRVVDELVRELRGYARDLLGITDLERRVAQLMPDPARHPRLPERVALRARGASLLRASASLDGDDPVHPAFARILTELAPDEARILRLLVGEGARAAVDVRSANVIGIGSQLVAGGFSMIGPEAGVRHGERVQAYLNNLERLGLIWFSQEPIDDPVAYQVLEAQPDVMKAMRRASRARTVQRSIQLTPFGEGFCAVCLPTDNAEVEALSDPEL